MSSRPRISAPFDPVHLTAGSYSQQNTPAQQAQHPQQHQRNPSNSSLSPHTSPYLRPVSPASSTGSSPRQVRNFSRPTTPQNLHPTAPTTTSPPAKSTSPERRPQRKSLFKEENLDSLSPTTGHATAARTFGAVFELPSSHPQSSHDPQQGAPARRPSSSYSSHSHSSHLLPPPSPGAPAESHPTNDLQSAQAQAPLTPVSPTFLLSEPQPEAEPKRSMDNNRGRELDRSVERERQTRSASPQPPPSPSGSGLVSGERKRSMWERVLRRGSEEVDAFPVR